MKCFSSLTLVLMIALIISGCGTRGVLATPTLNAVDIQSSAAAVAFTMVAETQSAIPTATPPQPTATFTDTPAPTVTFPPLPSLETTFTAVPTGISGGEDPCIHQVLPAALEGETVKIRIDNSTKAALTVSVNLQQATPQSECGYRTYTLAPGEFLVINDLIEGCYTIWAWNPDPESYFIVTNGTSCLDNSEPWVFDISTGSIQLKT